MGLFKALRGTSDSGPPPIPVHSRPPNAASPFVSMSNGQLYCQGKPYRFASFNAPDLLHKDTFWEIKDTLATLAMGFANPTVRTYTLTVKSKNKPKAHIEGWDGTANQWIYNEQEWLKIDHTLAKAAEYGVKVIVPIINQDYGKEDSDYVGNFNDLTRFIYNPSWTYKQAQEIDWFEDRRMIDSFKAIISSLLNRQNTINGRRYGDDPTILAWETGNEMNYKGKQPAPASWTIEIAQHIKSLAPKTLVMDGSMSRSDDVKASYPKEVLQSPYVDILTYHYYGGGDIKRLSKDVAVVQKYGKAFIAGEYGFFSWAPEFEEFLHVADSIGAAGSLVWSLRPHSHIGGFKTHSEGNEIFSFHCPGWQATSPEFDKREAQVVPMIRAASYRIAQQHIPRHPVPLKPHAWFGTSGFAFKGGAWAYTYEVWSFKDKELGGEGNCLISGITDNVKSGNLLVKFTQTLERGDWLRVRGIGVDGDPGPWSEPIAVQ